MKRFSLCLFVVVAAACGADRTSEPPDASTADLDHHDMSEATVDTGSIDAGGNDASIPEDAGGDAADASEPTIPHASSIFERGPYNVGHRRIDFTYDGALKSDREIRLVVWYPTLDEEGEPGTYLLNTQWPSVFSEASVAIDERAPVLVFSHGNSAVAEQSYFLTEWWASHGWVVVAPYHTGNTVWDAAGGITFDSAPDRPQDLSAVLDLLYDLPTDDPLHGKISDDVVVSGHSFGGYTSLAISGAEFAVDEMVALCAEPDAPSECEFLEGDGVEDLFRSGFLDERVDVSIPQAPGGYFVMREGIGAIDIPTLLFTGGLDRTLPPENEGDPIWDAMQGSHMRVDLLRGGHFTFSNMCQLIPSLAVDDGCSEEFIDPERAFEIINAYSLAFARYHLFGIESGLALLRGDDDRFSADVVLQHKPGALP